MKYNDIKEVLDKHFQGVKFDKELMNSIKTYRIGWMQKSPEYMQFLGGVLIGTVPIRFSTRDEDDLFADILNLDMTRVRSELYNVKGVNKKWNISSNPYYLTLGYMLHRFTTSTSIGKYKEEALRETYLIYAYKIIGSLIAHYFKWDTPEAIAKATYEKLSNKYLIKKYSSWQELFEYRSKDILPTGLHHKRIVDYTTDDAMYIANDVQGRIRDTVKHIYTVMMRIVEDDGSIVSTSMIDDTGETSTTTAITDRPDKLITYLNGIVTKPNDFVNDDLIYLVTVILKNVKPDVLKTTLLHMSNEYYTKKHKTELAPEIINYSINYLHGKNLHTDYHNRVMEVMKHLKGYWSASSVKDKTVLTIKNEIDKEVKLATGVKTNWVVVNTTICVILYTFLRSIAKV